MTHVIKHLPGNKTIVIIDSHISEVDLNSLINEIIDKYSGKRLFLETPKNNYYVIKELLNKGYQTGEIYMNINNYDSWMGFSLNQHIIKR